MCMFVISRFDNRFRSGPSYCLIKGQVSSTLQEISTGGPQEKLGDVFTRDFVTFASARSLV